MTSGGSCASSHSSARRPLSSSPRAPQLAMSAEKTRSGCGGQLGNSDCGPSAAKATPRRYSTSSTSIVLILCLAAFAAKGEILALAHDFHEVVRRHEHSWLASQIKPHVASDAKCAS